MATPVPEGAAYLTEQVELIVNNSVIDEVTSTSFPFSTFNSWESSPSYLQFLIGSFNYFYDSFLNIFFPTSSSSPSTSNSASASPGFISRIILDTELCLQNLSFNDVNLIIALSLFWAILRYLTTKHIFKVSFVNIYMIAYVMIYPLYSHSHRDINFVKRMELKFQNLDGNCYSIQYLGYQLHMFYSFKRMEYIFLNHRRCGMDTRYRKIYQRPYILFIWFRQVFMSMQHIQSYLKIHGERIHWLWLLIISLLLLF